MLPTVLVGVVAVLGTLIAQCLVGPLVVPWYSERLQKSQARVIRRANGRQMIENELEKGMEDLSGVRTFAIAIRWGKRDEFDALKLYALHEEKWGVWRPYLLQDSELLDKCEDYRSIIRDLRGAVFAISADEIEEREKAVASKMSAAAQKVVALLDERGW